MAMTKKELAEMEELKIKLALHFTPAVEKDLAPPKYNFTEGISRLVRGWSYNANAGNDKISKSCSSSAFHGHNWEKTSSCGEIPQFSTELLALRALRHEVEIQCAKRLRDIDLKIEACEKAELEAVKNV